MSIPHQLSTWPLNAADRFLLAIDRTIRRLRGPGFETQTFVSLAGRIEPARLRAALAALTQRYPAVAARLVEAGGPVWRLRPSGTCELQETNLARPGMQAVLDHAAGLMSAPTDPARVDPIRVHLLHRPDGQDALILQYNHTLVDHSDAILLLRQLQRFGGASGTDSGDAGSHGDAIWTYLKRFPRERRRAAAKAVEHWSRSLRGGALQVGREAPGSGAVSFRLAARRLEPAATSALAAHTVRTCGVPSLSMAVLASAFRAVAQLAGPAAKGGYVNAGIGMDLGLSRGDGPALHNLATLVPLRADRADLADRDALMQMLSRQLRSHLAADIDLGILEHSAVFGRRQRQARWLIELMLRYCLSLWYGSFGTLRGLGTELYGVPIDAVFCAGPAWAPVGLTLLVNQFQGRLFLQATYVADCVPEPLANAFLDAVIADLPTGTQ
jgi:hypothetical protein